METSETKAIFVSLSQADAISLDQDLFNECKFSVDQLMELAGLSVASVIRNCYPVDQLPNRKVLVACGPGGSFFFLKKNRFIIAPNRSTINLKS